MIFAVGNAGLELVGLSLVFPLISLISNYEVAIEALRIWIPKNYLLENKKLVSFVACCAFLAFYLSKNIFQYLNLKALYNFSFSVRRRLSDELFSKYMSQKPAVFKSENSSSKLNMLSNEINVFTGSVLLPVIVSIADLFVAVAILGFLLFQAPVITAIVMSQIIIAGLFLFFVFKRQLGRLGEIRKDSETRRLSTARQAFDGHREIRVFGATKKFYERYSFHNANVNAAVSRINLIAAMPRSLLESVIVLCMGTILISIVIGWIHISEPLEVLGIFALASVRLMPASSRIVGTLQNIRAAYTSIYSIHKDLRSIDKVAVPVVVGCQNSSFHGFSKISFSNVSFKYPKMVEALISDVNIQFDAGKIYGVIGASGSGKSTIIDLLMGIHKPDSGSVLVDGISIEDREEIWWESISLMSQNDVVLDDDIFTNISLGADGLGPEALSSAIELAGLQDFISQSELGIRTQVGENGSSLSGGQRQRLCLARAIYQSRPILVLDEPASAQDKGHTDKIMGSLKFLKKQGRTIFLITHDHSQLSVCDHILKVNNKTASFES